MNISMYTCYALDQNFAHPVDAFSHFYKKGVRYADIVDDELEKLPLHYYCDCLDEAGLIPGSLVSMLNIADFNEEIKKKNLSILKGYIDQMEKIGIPLLMPAPSVKPALCDDEFKEMHSLMIEALCELTEYANGSGVKIAIENQSSLSRPDSKLEDIIKILNCVPELGFVFDTGNFFCVGENALKSYEVLKKRIVHSHFKDWKPDPFGCYERENILRFDGTTLGEGDMPLSEIITLLKRDNYDGNLVLEINSPLITLEMLDRSAEFLQTEINKVISI